MDKIDLILHEFQKVHSKLDSIETKMDRLETRMDSLEARMDSLEARIDNIEKNIAELNARVTNVENNITELNARVTNVENNITEIKTKITNIEVVQLENNVIPRLNTIESCYTDTYQRYRNNNDKIEQFLPHIEILIETVSKHSEKLDKIS